MLRLGRKLQELEALRWLTPPASAKLIKTRMTEDSKMNPVSALRASVSTGALFRAALLTAAGILLACAPADAALYYYRDSDPGISGSA